MNGRDCAESVRQACKQRVTTLQHPPAKKLQLTSERAGGVDPEQQGAGVAERSPAMGQLAGKIEAVAGLQHVMLQLVQPDLELSTQHVDELLAFMLIGSAARRPRCYAEEMRFHLADAKGQ